MQKDIVYIYSLTHPITNVVAYVGKTDNINRRYKEHCKNTKNLNMYNWIKKIHDEGLQPVMSIIETCSKINWEEREKYWIAYYGLENLINIQEGGAFVALYPVKKKKKEKTALVQEQIVEFKNIDFNDTSVQNTMDEYKKYHLKLILNEHKSIASALWQYRHGKITKASNIEARFLEIFANEKKPEKLFAECLTEYERVQKIFNNQK